jgi:hypothetical protein
MADRPSPAMAIGYSIFTTCIALNLVSELPIDE